MPPSQLTFHNPLDSTTRTRVGVMVLVRNPQQHILMEQRSDCALWGFPGGRIEPGESIGDAAIREVREETGLETRVKRLRGIYSSPTHGRIVQYPQSHETIQLIDAMVEVEIISGTLLRSPESLDLKFFPPDHLPPDQQICPPILPALRDILAEKIPVLD